MNYANRIQTLNEALRNLERRMRDAGCNVNEMSELSNRKSEYESEIRRLNRLQWEEDTQRVNFEDDR